MPTCELGADLRWGGLIPDEPGASETGASETGASETGASETSASETGVSASQQLRTHQPNRAGKPLVTSVVTEQV